jgi:hypothetical protein
MVLVMATSRLSLYLTIAAQLLTSTYCSTLLHDEISAMVTDKYSAAFESGPFCPDVAQDCSSYFEGLNAMLDSSSRMISLNPQITGPVQPIAMRVLDHSVQTVVPTIADPDIAAALQTFLTEDQRLANYALANKNDEVVAITTHIRRLRIALAMYADQVSESIYLSEEIPLSTLAPTMRSIGSLFQRLLFNWHLVEGNRVNFYQRLLPSEQRYLELFFELYGYEHYNFNFGLWYGNRMSSFTWSHRSRTSENSIRFACGTTSQEEPFALFAMDVLKERAITLGEEFDSNNQEFSFYGLGWDLQESSFKVYIMFHGGIASLPKTYREMAEEKLTEVGIDLANVQVHSHGLISLTYNDGSHDHAVQLHEKKVYLYPTIASASRHHSNSAQAKERILDIQTDTTENVAWLLASKRGFVPQYDTKMTLESIASWKEFLSHFGASLIDKYASINLHLETIAYQSRDKWTLYFPAGSG